MEELKTLLEAIGNGGDFSSLLKSTTNFLASLALYVTLALAVALIVWAVVVRNKDEQYLVGVRKTMIGIVAGYALGIIVMIGSLRFLRDYGKGDITWHVWLIMGAIVLIIVGVVAVAVLHKKQMKAYKWLALALVVAAVIVTVVLLVVVEPMQEEMDDGSVYIYNAQNPVLMYIISAILVAAIAALTFIGEKPAEYSTKSLTYAAICIAVSFALSYIKFFSMPQGGSVTLASLLPLALYSYMFGTRKGVVAGIVYGLLQFIQSPQPYHMMQILLDYPIAFGAIGIAGIGRKMKFLKGNVHLEFVVGTTLAVVLRYISHVVSGYFVFYTWAGDQNPLVYSLVYNSSTFVDLAIVLVVGALALSSKSLRRMVLSANAAPAVESARLQAQTEDK